MVIVELTLKSGVVRIVAFKAEGATDDEGADSFVQRLAKLEWLGARDSDGAFFIRADDVSFARARSATVAEHGTSPATLGDSETKP